MPTGKITSHFTWEEMLFSEYAVRHGIDNRPATDALSNSIIATAFQLEIIRTLLAEPIRVLSGYRCRTLNAAIGGSTTSAHMQGMAADIIPTGLSRYDAAARIASSSLDFDQLILEYYSSPTSGWIHVGFSRTKPRRQLLTKKSASSQYLPGLIN
jgi:zinc D-Ala-D-Ala carboxypeptidase